jgi:type IV pilus assembly protein PilY1
MKKIVAALSVVLGLVFVPRLGFSEDVDLFLGFPAGSARAPNVLFIIDNTGNWSAPFDEEMTALKAVWQGLPEGEINVGMMMFTETGGDDNNIGGGYMRAAIRPVDPNSIEAYTAMIDGFDDNIDKGNAGQGSLAMAEAYYYFDGATPYSGNGKAKTDYLNNRYYNHNDPNSATCCEESHDVWALPGNALASKDGSPYLSPVDPNDCSRNYIIWVGNGPAQDSNSTKVQSSNQLVGLGWPSDSGGGPNLKGGAKLVDLGDRQTSVASFADEWASFMKQSPLDITTFTIDVNKSLTGQGPEWTEVLKSMARESGGQYYDVAADPNDIVGAINDALSRILARNSVFASVALPASTNAQSTYLNQVYIGLFRPDENALPRWFGNVKQYKLGFDSGNVLRLLDADDEVVVDPGTGFVNECARSFWTPPGLDSYWSHVPEAQRRGTCRNETRYPGVIAQPAGISNTPDGPVVEKGGTAYVMRSMSDPGARDIRTCTTVTTPTSNLCSVLTDFDEGNTAITSAMLGAATDAERTELIQWAIGYDVDNEDGDLRPNGDPLTNEVRPSLHGDIIHSQPVAIDYAADPNNPQTVVFYGGNDGMLRAINGNRSTTFSSAAAGEEFWAFMPPEFYNKIKRNRTNTPEVRFPASGVWAGSGQQKPYGPDGPLTVYSGASSRYLYMGLRRGGRSVYAFDVTNINSPTLMWRKGCPNLANDTGCTSGWTEIGETWSPANVATVEGRTNPVLLMGGGYDDCEDYDDDSTANHNCDSSAKGNIVYVLDAVTGAILETFDTERSVVGPITPVTVSDANRNIAFAYFGDTGGNIYRISGNTANSLIGSTDPTSWTLTQIASFGCGTTADATCTANRKFLFGPDVVRVPRQDYTYAILVGSGDREKPLVDYGAAAGVQNYFFSFIDKPLISAWLDDDPVVCNDDMFCLGSLVDVDPNGPLDPNSPVGERGWKLALDSGEQVVSGALTIADVVNFSTHIPFQRDSNSCESDLGKAQVYNLSYLEGEGDKNLIIGGGLVPTPVAGKVILDDGQIVPFCIGCGGEGSAIGGSEVTSGVTWSQAKNRVYWNIVK